MNYHDAFDAMMGNPKKSVEKLDKMMDQIKESELAVARNKAGWDFKEGEPSNPYLKNSPTWWAYEEEFFNIYMTGLYAEQGQ